jgi:hypothetical protein
LEYDLDKDSTIEADLDKVDLHKEVEPEPSIPNHNKYKTFWIPTDQLNTQIHTYQLCQLYTKIKAQATLPDPIYQKLLYTWPARLFDICILPDSVQNPINYFDLL